MKIMFAICVQMDAPNAIKINVFPVLINII